MLHGGTKKTESAHRYYGERNFFLVSFEILSWIGAQKTYLLPATFIKGADRRVELFDGDSHGQSKTRLATRGNETKGGGNLQRFIDGCETDAAHKIKMCDASKLFDTFTEVNTGGGS